MLSRSVHAISGLLLEVVSHQRGLRDYSTFTPGHNQVCLIYPLPFIKNIPLVNAQNIPWTFVKGHP